MSVRVFDVKLGSPAYEAGLQIGDRIYDIDGSEINEPADIADALRNLRPNDEVKVRVRRGNNRSRRALTVTGVGRAGQKKKLHRLGVATTPERFYRRENSLLRSRTR